MKPNYSRNKGEKSYRKEQFVLQELFKVYAPKIHTEMEYPIYMGGQLIAKPDLVDLDNKIAYRLNGESHQGLRKIKDENQKLWLETMGWKVTDIEKDSWEWNWLWKTNKETF